MTLPQRLAEIEERLKRARGYGPFDSDTNLQVDLSMLLEVVKVQRKALQLIKYAPALGGLDYKSTKKWREGTMKVIDQVSKEALAKVDQLLGVKGE